VTAADPRVFWDALLTGGYRPHGRLHDFRSRCPEHDGDNADSLHVTLAPTGEILIHCFAHGCPVERIVERLGLRMPDLFPTDRYYPRRFQAARHEDFTGNFKTAAAVLLAAQRLGVRCRVSIGLDECPNCERPHPLLVIDSTGEPFLHCERECGTDAFFSGLAERLWQRGNDELR
jgi:hypothetical protein